MLFAADWQRRRPLGEAAARIGEQEHACEGRMMASVRARWSMLAAPAGPLGRAPARRRRRPSRRRMRR